ncbi:MAG: hypothetical protein CL579_06125 [Alteromonadaceae bacterium]|nr:hypothetical protein [Alteromonadaceae bacterium]MBB19903.1 hypothetical protein [Rickettsiales bacterium]
MQINAANQSMNPLASSDVGRPKGPPPPPPEGGVPPGMESAVSTLSSEEQNAVTDMLSSLSKDQQSSLKSQLDSLRDSASSMSEDELGAAFKDMLTSLTGNQSSTSSINQVDTYA